MRYRTLSSCTARIFEPGHDLRKSRQWCFKVRRSSGGNTLDPEQIGDLYAASTDDAAWLNLGNKIAQILGVNTAGLWTIENGRISDMVLCDSHRESMEPYLAHFAALDVWTAGVMRNPRDSVYLTPETVPEEELVRTEFYNDFARKYGHFRPMGAVLTIEPGVVASVSIENRFASTPFELADKALLEPLLPHLRRLVQLRRLWTTQTHREGLRIAALDSIAFGLIVCGADGRVAFMNAAAEKLTGILGNIEFSTRGGLIGGRLGQETKQLQALIRDAATGGAGGTMQLSGSDGHSALIALVSPLPGSIGIEGGQFALVALQRSDEVSGFTEGVIGKAFKLTPVQASIALALLKGRSVEDIVQERGIKVSTVRWHLADIFSRTGTSNQRELIHLLGRLPQLRRNGS